VFGAIRSQSGSSTNPWLFTGEQWDGESGLYYLRARYYDPAIGRLVTKDPIPGGNLYAYAGNNPVRCVDPGGLCIPGYNCPPGQGGGIFPPFLPISKEGNTFASTPGPCWIVAGLQGCVHEPYETLCYTEDGRPYVCPKPPVIAGSCPPCQVAANLFQGASDFLKAIEDALTDPACVGWSVVAVTADGVTLASAYGVITVPFTISQGVTVTSLLAGRAANACLDAIEREAY
jgi:RHS repeat-associated protein